MGRRKWLEDRVREPRPGYTSSVCGAPNLCANPRRGAGFANRGALSILRCMRVSDIGRVVEEQVENCRRCHRQFEGLRYDFRE